MKSSATPSSPPDSGGQRSTYPSSQIAKSTNSVSNVSNVKNTANVGVNTVINTASSISIKAIISTLVVSLAVVTVIGVVGAITTGFLPTPFAPVSLQGDWVFQINGNVSCDWVVPYNNWSKSVIQENSSFYSDPNDQPAIFNGTIKKNKVNFSIILENGVSPDGCGDFSEVSGVLNGNTITGDFQGHDCGNNCVWNGKFTVEIKK